MAGVPGDPLTQVSQMSRLMTMARPTGFGRTCTHLGFRFIPVEGAGEWEAVCPISA